MEHKYDVFISYSRKDYVDENENVLPDSPVNAILNFLDENKISYWFDKKGLYKGAEFVEVISDAIAESKMMIFLSSTNSNESIYTAGEIFEAIENKKLIIPIKVDDSKYNKKFRILVNPLDYVDYKKADAFSDLLKAIECEKAKIAEQEREAAKKAEELKKREWKEAVKTEILEQAEELNKLKETSKALLDSIYKKMRTIDINQKQCPICGAKTEIDTEYCKTCGWFFPALSSIDGVGIEADKSAIILARSRWESKSCSFEGNEENKRKQLLQEIEQLNNKISLLEKEAQEKCTECKNKQQKELKNQQQRFVEQEEQSGRFTANGVSFTMIRVQGGTYQMGASADDDEAYDNEKPRHIETVGNFMIGETPVTQALWQAVMGSNPSYFTGDMQRPVENVSWDDCQTFIRKLNQLTGENFRLPTEAEWEYAARGGNRSQGYKYSGGNDAEAVAWYGDNSDGTTHRVKTKQPNELGIYDMSGNVYEWCQDEWCDDYYSPRNSGYRVLRGGSWNGSARYVRVSDRISRYPGLRDYNSGLRLAFLSFTPCSKLKKEKQWYLCREQAE